ncbi:MAG: putative toxin-antitoxin system toxin component, PIN family [Bacteroidia bacterium]|nr:putative toxin-antitoxin system toxin component, PIN family [Bacteroidia bacterium]
MISKQVILDTNLWISILISKNFVFIDNYVDKGKVKLIFSEESIQEFITVASRPKFEKYFSEIDIHNLLRIFDLYGELVKVTTKVNECRDFKDNFLLNLAIDSHADYLVTGDSDLLDLRKINKTEIITIKELIAKLNKARRHGKINESQK